MAASENVFILPKGDIKTSGKCNSYTYVFIIPFVGVALKCKNLLKEAVIASALLKY